MILADKSVEIRLFRVFIEQMNAIYFERSVYHFYGRKL